MAISARWGELSRPSAITKPSSFLINTARGSVVDEKALIEEYIKTDNDLIVEIDESKDVKNQIEKV